ncbi:hypothetical protein SKAU_G00097210 [Synaphobranchus kaupii]|uniref:Uncharacterized protein n=1 Tax=Synaphobranchus kaupii TaxID=118154 RepID=A0A9Q1J736_SYNKA|nr:hypothetical protein SKAU_G00097210 [Synaphobranchus kaupii]
MEGHAGERVFAWALLISLITQVCCQLCAGPCNCPGLVPHCREGVPLVSDGCQCCQMCARQKGEACNDKYICDIQQGLQCDYSASYPGGPGECVSQDELGCEFNGVTYQKGQKFQLSCSGMCTCLGGGIACVSLCPPSIRLASPDCPHPQQVRRPGQCCKEWVCEDMDNTVQQDALTAHRPHKLWPGVSGQNQNQIQNQIQIRNQIQHSATSCIEQSTEWSACSRTCGPGVSVRVSNQNRVCHLERQMRFCQVRPCRTILSRTRAGGGWCKASYRAALPERLEYRGCQSTRTYRPRYCGLCSSNRCCTPFRTHTVQVAFTCPTNGRKGRYPASTPSW